MARIGIPVTMPGVLTDLDAAPVQFADDTGLALAAVRAAAERIAGSANPIGRVKHGGDWVTDTDLACEQDIRRILAPSGYPVLGEEFGGELSADSPTWVVDPVDGTWNFATGSPLVAVLVCRIPPGETRADLAVVSLPLLGQEYVAWRGHGAWHGSRRLHVSAHPLTTVCVGQVDASVRLPDGARPRVFGCAGAETCMVASGVHSAIYHKGSINLWDVAAGGLLIGEAGGAVVSDPQPVTGLATVFTAGPRRLVDDLVQLNGASDPVDSTV